MTEKWIQGMHMKKGALRKSLHVKEGYKIPTSKLKKAEHRKNPTTAKRARLAETLKSFHHSKESDMKSNYKEEEVKKDKKSHKGLMGALKRHFKSDEHNEDREVKEDENEEKHYKSKNMDKGSRKKMAVMLMKKKMA